MNDLQQQVVDLQKQVHDLQFKIDMIIKPDKYLFQRDIDFLNAKIGKTTKSYIGFYGTTPIIQPSYNGRASDVSGSGGPAMTGGVGFNGNIGTTYYGPGDVVQNLKNLGLIKL